MSAMQAIRFELAHAARNCQDQATRARLLLKMAAIDDKIRAFKVMP